MMPVFIGIFEIQALLSLFSYLPMYFPLLPFSICSMTPIDFPKRKKRSFLSFNYKQVSYDGHFDSNRYLSTFLTSIPYPFETILVEHLHHISLSNAILKVSIFITDLFMNFFHACCKNIS